MIMFTVLLALLLVAGILSLVGAGAFFVVFGDVIVFGLIIGLIVRLLIGKKKKS